MLSFTDYLMCVCMYVCVCVCIYSISISILCVSREEPPSLIESNEQIYDLFK